MKLFRLRNKLSLLQKVCLSGLLIAIIMLLQKIIAINYVPGLPFVRISLGGPALIIFSSIFLGPWFGMLIGFASDLFGYFFFDASGGGLLPQITAIYTLLGFLPYFIYELVRKIYSKKVIITIECLTFAGFLGAVTWYLATNTSLDLVIKIGFPIGLLVLTIALVVFVFIFDRRYKFELGFNVFQISFGAFISEVLVLLLFGCLMKAWAFGFSIYLLIFMCQTLVLFFNVAMETVLISILFKLTKKYMSYNVE